MGIDAVIVLAVVAAVIAVLASTRIPADALLVGALTFLVVVPAPSEPGWKFGILSTGEALGGFSNPGMITVAFLFVVVRGLRETGGIDWLAGRVLGRPRTLRRALCRMLFPVVGMSTFLNNTPVVAMLIPAVSDWAKKLRLQPSKLMIPLSYAAILGGTCSLIGTSTNLVVSGLVMTQAGLPPLHMFDITWVGLPCAVAGALFLLLGGPKLLPDRGSPASELSNPREYTAEMIVSEDSALVGKSIEEAGLRHLPGAYIAEIDRDGESMPAVSSEQRLKANDRLIFVGIVESIKDLQNLRGLVPATDQVFKLDSPRHGRRLFEAVVSNSCPLVGRTIREGRFRQRYNAAVIAVARGGERIRSKIGDIELRPGDTLLLEAAPAFATQQRDSRDFFLVSPLSDSAPRRHERAWLAVAILAAMVAAATLGVVSMLVAVMLAASLMVVTRCCSVSQARRSIDWPVLIVIAAALGLGRALELSGAGAALAGSLISAAGNHPWLALAAVYAITSILTEVVTNNAAVALVFPIAMSAAGGLGADPFPFIIAIMMAGSASFATPLGYQTNLMVYGPGGYRFGDFLRIGIPMNVLAGLITIGLTPLLWPF